MAATTTVKVSRTTLAELEKLRDKLQTRSLDDAIKALIKKHRQEVLRDAFGSDRGKIKPFAESDRGEDL
jgi:predicted CopG family antitoxin